MATQSQLGTVNSILASTMALGIPAGLSTDKFETVNQYLALTQSVAGQLDIYPVADTIAFSSVVNLTRNLTVNQSISFAQRAGQTRDAVVSQNLGLSDTVLGFNYVDDRNPVEQVIGFSQVVLLSQALSVDQNLGLTQTVSIHAPYRASVSHFLGIHQHTSTPHRRWVAQDLGIEHIVRIPIPLIVNQTISFVQDSPIGRFDDLITFTQSASGAKGYVIKQDISFVHTNNVQGIFIRSVDQDSGLIQTLTFFEDTPCYRKQYHPFQGEGATPPDNLLAGQGQLLDRFSLYQPTLGPRSLEVILRAPEMDDRDRNAYNRVQGETRGGRIRVYADPIWPKVRTMAITITGVTETKVDELHTFLDATLGQQIGFTDWKGNLWAGTVMNPSEAATQDGRGRWTINLEIEAEPVDTVIPGSSEDGQTVTFSQSVGVVKV